MCNGENAFTEYVRLKQPQEISLGDGHLVKATGKGTVLLKIAIGQNQIQRCEPKDVCLYQSSPTACLVFPE